MRIEQCSIFAPSYQQVATLFVAKVNKKAERHNGNIKKNKLCRNKNLRI